MKNRILLVTLVCIGLFGLVLSFSSSKVEAQQNYYLKVYKHDTYRGLMKTFPYTGDLSFRPWEDPINDKMSSFEFLLPPGVSVTLYEDRNEGPDSRKRTWNGTGKLERVNEKDMPGYLSDDCSAHKFSKP